MISPVFFQNKKVLFENSKLLYSTLYFIQWKLSRELKLAIYSSNKANEHTVTEKENSRLTK